VGLEKRARELEASFNRFLHPLRHAHAPAWYQVSKPLARWLRKLPKPVGILAVHDYRARVILSLCEQMGLRVPEEVAVLGIDNDPIICEYSSPTLSSVSRDPFDYGVAAAQQLECLLKKKTLEQHTILISPAGVVQRQSTQRLYSGDPLIRQVADYLSQRSSSRNNVQSVAKHLKLSRRTLELHFKEHLHMTPGRYIQTFRITRAKALLLQRDVYQTISEIAYAAGFGSVPAFRAVFLTHTGKTPSQYRRMERPVG
jgi:LacI family transcriptional regulator